MFSINLMVSLTEVFLVRKYVIASGTGFLEKLQKDFGDALSIPLYNHTEVEIVFRSSQSVKHAAACKVHGDLVNCSSHFRHRVTVQDDVVNIDKLTPADTGNYMVSDFYGKNIVTVALRVEAYQQEYTEYAGTNVEISIQACMQPSVLRFRPTIFGKPVQLCSIQNGDGLCHADLKDSVSVANYKIQVNDLTSQHHGIYELIDKDLEITLCNISVHIKGHKESVALQPGALLVINFYTHTAVIVNFVPESERKSKQLLLNGTVIQDGKAELRSGYLIIRRVTPAYQGHYQVYDLREQHLYNEVKVRVTESLSNVEFREESQTAHHIPRIVLIALGVLMVIAAVGVIVMQQMRKKQTRTHSANTTAPKEETAVDYS